MEKTFGKFVLSSDFINKMKVEKIAVNCRTEEECIKFFDFLKTNQITWCDGEFLGETYYDDYKSHTCYVLDFYGEGVSYGKSGFWEREKCYIISFDELIFPREQKPNKSQILSEEVMIDKNGLVKRVLRNGDVVIVFFADGTKQVAKPVDGDEFDLEKAVAMALAKKFIGGYTEFEKVLESVEEVKKKDDYVVIINSGMSYSTYTGFFELNGLSRFEKDYNYMVSLKNGTKCKLLEVGRHEEDKGNVCVLEYLGKVYLVGEKGVRFCK